MTTVFYEEPELVIALNRKAIFVNPNDLQIFKELTLPEKLDVIKKEEAAATSSATGTDAAKQEPEQPQTHTPATIQHVRYSPNRQLIAVTTAGTKAVLLYSSRPEHAKLLSVRELSRAASALTFAQDSSSLLVTDKSGDCYLYDCVQVEALPRLLLGHLAIVYDVAWTPDSKYIITCDRDDKIRVTNYPNTYDIHTYCLGHKEFVTGLALLEGSALLSVSGDGTLRVWNYENGEELYKYELPAPALRLNLKPSQEPGKYLVSVQLHQPQESIGLYELSQADDKWSAKELVLYNLDEAVVNNFCFVEDRLYAATVAEDRLKLQVYDATGNAWSPKENWLEMVHEQFADDAYTLEDYSVWFKKRYDNVSEYLERKRRRIEEKSKSRNEK